MTLRKEIPDDQYQFNYDHAKSIISHTYIQYYAFLHKIACKTCVHDQIYKIMVIFVV